MLLHELILHPFLLLRSIPLQGRITISLSTYQRDILAVSSLHVINEAAVNIPVLSLCVAICFHSSWVKIQLWNG